MSANERKERELRLDGPEQATDGWHVRTGLDFRQVEDLLDWLEVRGVSRREVELSRDQQGFTVRWSR